MRWTVLGSQMALVGSILMAGAFFAFSSFVMPGLAKLTPSEGIRAMQGINSGATTSPLFLAVFVGTALLSFVLAAAGLFASERVPWELFAASALYLVGAFGVTVLFNVPRNEALAALDPSAASAAAEWARYSDEWTMWNHVRTVSALASCLAFAYASAQ